MKKNKKIARKKTPVKTKAVREANFKRWRIERGIKMVMTITKTNSGRQAICFFEGSEYVAFGKTNTEALNACIKLVISGNKLESK